MSDWALDALTQYDFTVKKISKIRGGYLCDTDKGAKTLSYYGGTIPRLEFQKELLDKIEEQNIIKVDTIVKTKEDQLLSQGFDGLNYTVRNYYNGKEMDLKQIKDICKMGQTLSILHNIFDKVDVKCPGFKSSGAEIIDIYNKYTIEMKRARQFIIKKQRKQNYESMLLKAYDQFNSYAVDSMKKIIDSIDKIQNKSLYTHLRHGSYNYHNVTVNGKNTIVFGCGMARYDLQVRDLYDILRKTMEKNNWNKDIGLTLISGYTGFKSLSKEEMCLLSGMLSYPYKYWKLMNHYINANKAWIPDRNILKLEKIMSQQDEKYRFIKDINS